jgi:hypothetical protein
MKESFVNRKYLFYMTVKSIIKRVLKEQSEEWLDITPEYYIDLLKYVNGDGSLIKRLPDYRGKKIRVTGDLSFNEGRDVSNIDSIDYVDGKLDISSTNISYFDKDKVKGRFSYWNSKMWKIERQKILNQKLSTLDEYRQEGEWDVTNDDDESNETEALYMHLRSEGIVNEYENDEGEEKEEDKYFIWKTKYKHYGNTSMYEWLGSDKFESEWIVIPDDEIQNAATESLKQRIDEMGYEAFTSWVWENNLDEKEVENWLYDFYEGDVRDSPEDFGIEKELTSQQERYVEIYEEKINRLNNRLNSEDLTDEEIEDIEDEITGAEELIEDIKENPEGDYSEEGIEDAIQSRVEDTSNYFVGFLKDMGYEPKYILQFVDIDGVCEDIIRNDGYGNILSSYDGSDDEYKVNDKWYHVMRHN